MQMNKSEIIQTLRNEAKTDKATEAAFQVCAVRNRARNRVTVDGLIQRMHIEGFTDYDETDAVRFLEILTRTGFGRLEKDAKGHVKALTDIKVTLQSIGRVACGEEVDLDKFKKRNRYVKLAEVPKAAMLATPAKPAPKTVAVPKLAPKALVRPVAPPRRATVGLTFHVGAREIKLPLSDDLTPEEIAMIVAKFQDRKHA